MKRSCYILYDILEPVFVCVLHAWPVSVTLKYDILEPVFVCVLHAWPVSATLKFTINQITGLACRNLLRPCGHATAN
jgi:hypothetical protein